ncbi:hypothetical protein BDZ89DRAFT_1065004 [Hymenopellis radicata]|nr:hypothetical protein BDZ89DRAFT_1065004 [Hymenopellis radicata]
MTPSPPSPISPAAFFTHIQSVPPRMTRPVLTPTVANIPSFPPHNYIPNPRATPASASTSRTYYVSTQGGNATLPPPTPRLSPTELPPEEDVPVCPLPSASPGLSGIWVDLAGDDRDFDELDVKKPATTPPCSSMTLWSEYFAWDIAVHGSPVSIGDVVTAIRESLSMGVTEAEFEVLCPGQEMKDVLCRRYFLRKTIFVGLEATKEPGVWIFRVEEP